MSDAERIEQLQKKWSELPFDFPCYDEVHWVCRLALDQLKSQAELDPHCAAVGCQIGGCVSKVEALTATIERITEVVQKWLDAYPPDIFGEVTEAERKEHPGLITRNSAAMGRHMATQLLEQISAIRSDQTGS